MSQTLPQRASMNSPPRSWKCVTRRMWPSLPLETRQARLRSLQGWKRRYPALVVELWRHSFLFVSSVSVSCSERDFDFQGARHSFASVATSPLALRWMRGSPRTGCARRITPIYMWREQAIIRVIMACDLYCCLLPQCEALRTCLSGFPIATKWCCDQDVKLSWHGPRFFRPGPPIARNIQPITARKPRTFVFFKPARPWPATQLETCLLFPHKSKYLPWLFCLLWNMIGCISHVMWQAQYTKIHA